jgi:hypothetical protein
VERDPEHEAFWDVADDFIDSGRVEEGTVMGHHCLRAMTGGGFVATIERSSGNLVVKLPRARVAELVDAGAGLPFAPAGKVFREWVAIPGRDAEQWYGLIAESIAFVG